MENIDDESGNSSVDDDADADTVKGNDTTNKKCRINGPDDTDIYAQYKHTTLHFRNFMLRNGSNNDKCTPEWEYDERKCIIVQVFDVGNKYHQYKGVIINCINRKYKVFLQRDKNANELDIFNTHVFPKQSLYMIAQVQ